MNLDLLKMSLLVIQIDNDSLAVSIDKINHSKNRDQQCIRLR